MEWIIKAALFYAVGIVVFGLIGATTFTIKVTHRDKPVRYPHLWAFCVLGTFWPVFLWQLVFPGRARP